MWTRPSPCVASESCCDARASSTPRLSSSCSDSCYSTRASGQGELLVARDLASADAVGAALRYQLRQRLDAVFSLQAAQLRFRVARRRPLDLSTEVPLSPEEFLAGRPRLRDQVSPVPPIASGPRVSSGGRHRGCATEEETWDAPAVEPARPRASAPHQHTKPPPVRQDPTRARALETLGLGPSADRGAVQRAFRQLASECHPDRFPRASCRERAELMRRFARLSSAYHSLVA